MVCCSHTDMLYLLVTKSNSQKQPMDCSIQKAVLKSFAIFTAKHLCWSLFFNEVAGTQASNTEGFR